MVSRGGRSKGCSNCRRRKVKCDEARPICLRCKKRGIDCDGPRNPLWIDHSHTFTTKSPPDNSTVLNNPPIELSFAAFEDDICLAYTRKNLLRGGPVEVACNKIYFSESAPILSRDPALFLLRKAILSLSITFFGNQHHQDRMTAKGYEQYGEVLQLLNTTLTVPEHQTTNETLLTALTCMLLEIFLPTGPANFLKHQRGIEAIMCLRGPPTESTGETATIFRGLRIVSIISALAESRPSIYAKDEWKDAPIADTSEVGMLQHEIFAVLATCTQLMSESDALLSSEVGSEFYGPLIARVDNAMADLNALYPSWERVNNSQLTTADQASYMAKNLGIANHFSATAYMLYHTVQLCIIQIRDSLDPSPNNVELRNDAATKIAKCLELKEYEKRMGVAESNTIGFVATKVAWQALGGFETPEGRRLARVVKSAVNGVYRSPWEAQLARTDMSRAHPPETFFAQFVAKAKSTNPTRNIGGGRMYHLVPHEPELIDIGYKHMSPPAQELSPPTALP